MDTNCILVFRYGYGTWQALAVSEHGHEYVLGSAPTLEKLLEHTRGVNGERLALPLTVLPP